MTQADLIRHVISENAASRGGYVITPNVDHLQQISKQPHLREMAMRATIRVADGMPLVWASRLQGTPLPSRVAGSDLIDALAAALGETDQTVFLLGGEQGVGERAAQVLRGRYPGLGIIGAHCPPHGFENSPEALAAIADQLSSLGPDHVLLGLPFQKASLLAERLGPSLSRTWFYGLGISFSFLTNDVSRAPAWIQASGFEWLHRFVQEPRRLFRRYFVDGLPFVVKLLLASVHQRYSARSVHDQEQGDQ